MRCFLFCNLIIFLLLTQSVYSAKYLYPTLYIDKIICKSTNEKVDELYFEITETNISQKETSLNYYRVPTFPLFWKSDLLAAISTIPIWNGLLQEMNKISLSISMYEQDLPPLDPDDKLGEITIQLSRNNDQLLVKWQIPNTIAISAEPVSLNLSRKVIFKAHNAEYEIIFRLSNQFMQSIAKEKLSTSDKSKQADKILYEDPWALAFGSII